MVHLLNRENIVVLMEVEELVLVEEDALADGAHQDIHHALVHVSFRLHIAGVDQDGNSEGVIAKANYKQVDKLLARYIALWRILKLLIVVLLAVHLEDDVNVFGCD